MALPLSFRTANSSRWEGRLAILAVLMLIIGVVGFFIDRSQPRHPEPTYGGTYIEGVVTSSPTKMDSIIVQLTNIGLTYSDQNNAIQPALAKSLTVSSDNKTYTFHLQSGYSATGLLSTIQRTKTGWENLTITAPDESTLQFTLPQPLETFMASTAQALFPFGPYKVAIDSSKGTTLMANDQFVAGRPFISKIILKPYTSVSALTQAAKNGEIDGSSDLTSAPSSDFKLVNVNLPRYYVLVFNMTDKRFQSLSTRQRVINGVDGAPVTYNLVTINASQTNQLADSLKQSLAAKHIILNIQRVDATKIQQDIIPNHKFDLLIYGFDYGADPDYYNFWHSSQVPPAGLNISSTKDKKLDSQLEQTRAEIDPTKHQALNQQIQAYLDSQAYQKVLVQDQTSFVIVTSIKGVEYGTIDSVDERFDLVWRWYSKTKMVLDKK